MAEEEHKTLMILVDREQLASLIDMMVFMFLGQADRVVIASNPDSQPYCVIQLDTGTKQPEAKPEPNPIMSPRRGVS